MAKQASRKTPAIESTNIGAAAVDISSHEHIAAVNSDVTDAPLRAFGTLTHDLHDLAEWFKSHGVTSIAMESTGVYWFPAYEILAQHGFGAILVNARYAKIVPERKTDFSDARWLRRLHSYWLLRGSFRPSAQRATLRAHLRQRKRLVEYAAPHIWHMQKALMEINLQLHLVVSDITGVTGMKIIRAIVDSEHDLDVLASHRDKRCKASIETIKAKLHGMGPSLSLKLVSECGTDLRGWPSAKHFTSWLCLAPGNKISGGKVLSSRTRRSSNRAAALLRLAAVSIGRSDTALRAVYRRLAARAGKTIAVTATAPKIAVLFYNTLRHGMTNKDPGAYRWSQKFRPVVKVDRMMKEVIRNEETKEAFA